MTDYNDGKWHGWNGGECPVHPESEVEVCTKHKNSSKISDGKGVLPAKDYNWEHGICWYPIVAFRVVKPYREPRELWFDIEFGIANNTKWRDGLVLFREVLPD